MQPGSGHDADIVKTRGSRSRGNLNGQILALALPALVSLSVDPLMSAVDTAYIGRLGPDLGGGEVGQAVGGVEAIRQLERCRPCIEYCIGRVGLSHLYRNRTCIRTSYDSRLDATGWIPVDSFISYV